jgi:hypothetical protein
MAEDEASRISERTRAALQAAKRRGVKLGSPIAAKTIAAARVARSAPTPARPRPGEALQLSVLELDFTPVRIVREIAKVTGGNMADFVTIDDAGNPHIDLSSVKRCQLAAVGAVEGPIIEDGRVVKAPKIRTHDKLKALDMLAKMAGLYPAERTELTGADGGPIARANLNATVHKVDIEALEPEQREQLRAMLLALTAKQGEAGTSSED